MKCPICKENASHEGSLRPFCSARCRTVDLGKWVSEEYRISTPLSPDEFELAEIDPNEPN